jgi:competence protein ComEC
MIFIGIILLFSMVFIRFRHYKWQSLKTFLVLVGFLFAGMAATILRISPHRSENQMQALAHETCWTARIIDFPVEREKSMKTVVEILQSASGQPLQEKMLLYVQKDSLAQRLRYGDLLYVAFKPKEIMQPENPDAFDNQKYMSRKGIFFTGYAGNRHWEKIGRKVPNLFREVSRRMQQRLSQTFVLTGMSGREYDIIRAILLGDDDTMEPDLKASYAAAGVSHILCVSGMHVGIIFMIIDFLLKPLDLFRSTRILKVLLLLAVIWLYAGITGLSPSVTRSATMFTFVSVGSLMRRNTNVFHSLLASLFILLVINPLYIFEVGFQLSYSAVFSIVWFQPVIAGLYTCKTRIGRYFWELLSVSIAAQIGTFPISIYYFGQFPNYFILSNLSVITLSFIVMITGIFLLSVSWVPILAKWGAWLLTKEIRLMNGIISFIEKLPGSVTTNIDYSFPQVIFLYMCILLILITLKYHRRITGWLAYASFALFSFCFGIRKMELLRQDDVTVYAIRNVSAIDFCYRQQAILFSDSIRNEEDSLYGYSIRNHARKQHADRQFVSVDTSAFDATFLCKRGPFIRYGDKTFFLLKRKERLHQTTLKATVDVLILQHNPVQKPEEVAAILTFKKVMADKTVSNYYKERWRKWCKERGVEFQE